MLTLVATIVVFCLIIFIHELGHFVSAKLFGVTVHEFSIGMGPKIWGTNRGGTDYSVRALPVGGYVKLEGEDGASEDKNAFCNKGIFARFVVLASGAFMNFVLGFLLYIFLMSSATGFGSNVVGEVIEGSAFYDCGIESGDVIVRMESDKYSSKIRTFNDISFFTYRNGNDPVTITYVHDGVEKAIVGMVPKYSEEEGRYLYGFKAEVAPKTFGNVIKFAYHQSVFVGKVVVISFADLIRGRAGASDISGPVGIVSEIGNAARAGLANLVNLAALISINLGVINLLPIPALDGGRILFLIYELIRRKPVPADKEAMVHAIGFMILIGFMLIITFFDITKLFNNF